MIIIKCPFIFLFLCDFIFLQPSRYTAVLGPMFGGSFPASVAIYNLIKDSSDIVKLCVFGGVTLGVFAVASGLAATSLGTTPGTARYARFAALVAITVALSLFTGALCTLFVSQGYTIGCAIFFALLIAVLDMAWIYLEW
jgi:hypothetical protein